MVNPHRTPPNRRGVFIWADFVYLDLMSGPHRSSVISALIAPAALIALAGALFAGSRPAPVEDHPAPQGAVRYARDVRPILSDRCFTCHGPDATKRAAKLRLDTFEGATTTRDGSTPVVPGDSAKSELIKRITSTDPKLMMPPPDSGRKPLTERERQIMSAWVDSGAAYESHWAFVPPKKSNVPTGATNPVDAYVNAALAEKNIKPSGKADKTTLLRRVTMDLTGLPPTEAELDAFEKDTAPGAYERAVERLMTQEPYRSRLGERLAVPWLDAARYADTQGIHMDAGHQLWPYRDWVIGAFRDNMPFDRFITEQIAGDLLPNATTAQKVASGFNRCHVQTDEGGAIPEEYLVEYAVDRTATTGSVMLGLTMGCVRCHDHKYDPISMDDFYSLLAYFNSIEEPGLYSQTQDPQRAHEPFIEVPTPEHSAALEALNKQLADLKTEFNRDEPEDASRLAASISDTMTQAGVSWLPTKVTGVEGTNGVVFKESTTEPGVVMHDGTSKVPEKGDVSIELDVDEAQLRLICLEVLPGANGKVGLAFNGNAVVSEIDVQVAPRSDPAKKQPVPLAWAWADHSQRNGDFEITNVIPPAAGKAGLSRVWALQGYDMPGPRLAMLLSQKPFGFAGGARVTVTIKQQSMYAQHMIGKVRLSLGTISQAGLSLLPTTSSRFFTLGAFTAVSRNPDGSDGTGYSTTIGPESLTALDLTQAFEGKNWTLNDAMDGTLLELPPQLTVFYVAREVFAPIARKHPLSLGSDDGFQLYVGGAHAGERRIDRSGAPDQDKLPIELKAGRTLVIQKIINTAGQATAYQKLLPDPNAKNAKSLSGLEIAALAPESARTALGQRFSEIWRIRNIPRLVALLPQIKTKEQEVAQHKASTPKTMVMKELPEPRPTFVLTRGQYDRPDKNRPVTRRPPASFGAIPDGLEPNRLGLARWLTSSENPLVARVAVNRFWEIFFGYGIVRTVEDFGMQGEWPTHPELLDYLAVDFRESGWDVHRLIKMIVTSETYQRESRVRRDLAEIDPENKLLAYYPRHRLSAEQLRDQALYVSGLLVEKVGGPSVKPYQPEGLWQEVAMPESNTRLFVQGKGSELYRRSLYTYWKRAAPPPNMLTFDAPTREACTMRRPSTNTPLQALNLMNDVQYVEAARTLAQAAIKATSNDESRIGMIWRRTTGRTPTDAERSRIIASLGKFRDRFKADESDAKELIMHGESKADQSISPAELAAWTMVASAAFNLHESVTHE